MEAMAKYKPDWKQAMERLTAWWKGEKIDRVPALITARRKGVSPRSLKKIVPDMYTSPEVVFYNLDATLEATYWAGEAFPNHWVYLGPVPLSGILGCQMHFEENTVWHSPCFQTLEEAEKISFQEENCWYRLLFSLAEQSLRRSQGKYLVSGQGFGAASDVMADMWGAEKILLAMVEKPEIIRTILRKITEISCFLYDRMDTLVANYQPGRFDWLRLWAPGRFWTLQSDISCMVSPGLFQELILPELEKETQHVDFAFYHLDGPGAIKHVETLLRIKTLAGIQWVPGAGACCDPLDWLELFRSIQNAGKKLLVSCPPERVRALLEKVDRRSICLAISCKEQQDAEKILLELERIGG